MPVPLTKETDVDVLIIGAGPAGLMCGNALAKAGVNVRIVDQRPKRVAAGQADGIQPRTIEVFQSYGLAERLLREGNQMHMAAFYNPSPNGGIERTGRAPDVNASTARYPFEITLHQGAIEAIFLDSMRSMDVEVERPIVPTSLELSQDEAELKDPNAHPVKVVLKYLDPIEAGTETEIVHAKFVVGADGAHSWVRKTLGIAMEGEQTDFIWGVLDFVPETDFPDIRNRCAIHSNNGSCMIIPREGDTVRLYIQLTGTDAVDAATGRIDKSRLGPEKLLEVARKSFHPYTFATPKEVEWWTIYLIGQRVASKFSVSNRVFIAGDACHTHSPKAGQGMNASMNDTHNLAWKLSHVLRGWADLSLLDTASGFLYCRYEFERRKYAQDLINFDKKFSALFSGKPRTEENQEGVSHEEFIQAFRTFGMFTSGIGVHYGPSMLTNATHKKVASNLNIGQRMPSHIFVRPADARPIELQDVLPADTRFKLVVFAGAVTEPAQKARVEALADTLGAKGGLLSKDVVDIVTVCSGTVESVVLGSLPAVFRPHFTKVFVDDMDMHRRSGGGGYAAYGIDTQAGAIVVVRPDGFVGMVAPFEHVGDVESYFSAFRS
ncbi:uncharacterized protein FIBRA_03386 [Fibroporia radiculosa]|uniref:FAD-binding domain-containing protein n=1 Tax=Fibroporia radiculosa TaxID=599839 RepID=J4HVY8_9APHY|nr:uncharacterized protein FIBRA_03386 [Fibroporia radiculosa]CCM01337.1 predicted protein [Fibroporia radiculosa]